MGDVFKRCIKCLFSEIAKMFISRCIGFLAAVSIFVSCGTGFCGPWAQGPGGTKGQGGDQGHKGRAQGGPREGARGGGPRAK